MRLLVLLVALVAPALPADRAPLAASTPAPVAAPVFVVTVDARGVVSAEGAVPIQATIDEVEAPGLVAAIAAFHAGAPEGSVLVRGEADAPVAAVSVAVMSARGAPTALATPSGSVPLRRVPRSPSPSFDRAARPPLSVWLHDDATTLLRRVGSSIVLPSPDIETLRSAFAADLQLHPDARLAVVAADADVPYGRALAALELARAVGYPEVLFLAASAAPPQIAPERPPRPSERAETPTHAKLLPEGGVYVRPREGAGETLPHDALDAFEAWCDASTCDLVARSGDRRILLGPAPRADLRLGWLLARRVHTWEERLDATPPLFAGVASPFVRVPGTEAP